MSVIFTKLGNGNVKMDNGSQSSILRPSSSITVHPTDANLIYISESHNPSCRNEAIVIDWRSIATPTVANRNDAIVQLGTDFFFEIDVEAITDRITNLEERYEYYEIFESTSSGSGAVSKPTNSTIILNFYPEGVDALVTKLDSLGRPLDEPAVTAGGAVVTTTFDVNGNYVLSGTPSAYPVGIVYFIKIQAQYSDNVLPTQLVQQLQIGDEHTYNKVTTLSSSSTDVQYPSAKITYDSIESAKDDAVAMAVALG